MKDTGLKATGKRHEHLHSAQLCRGHWQTVNKAVHTHMRGLQALQRRVDALSALVDDPSHNGPTDELQQQLQELQQQLQDTEGDLQGTCPNGIAILATQRSVRFGVWGCSKSRTVANGMHNPGLLYFTIGLTLQLANGSGIWSTTLLLSHGHLQSHGLFICNWTAS